MPASLHSSGTRTHRGTWMKARFTCDCSDAGTLLVAPHARLARWLPWLDRFCTHQHQDEPACASDRDTARLMTRRE
jgi:hypothetical protein